MVKKEVKTKPNKFTGDSDRHDKFLLINVIRHVICTKAAQGV